MSTDTIISKAKTVTLDNDGDNVSYSIANFKNAKVWKVLECASELAALLGGPEVLSTIDKALGYLVNAESGEDKSSVIALVAKMAVESITSVPGVMKQARIPFCKFLGSLITSNQDYAKAYIDDLDLDEQLIRAGKIFMTIATPSETSDLIVTAVEFLSTEVKRTQLPPLLQALKKLR